MDLVLNIIVSVLLVIIIVLFIVFSKRIAVFNSSKKELAKFLEDFQESIIRAEKNINELKSMGDQVDENLKSQIKKARFLANDLSFLAEKGENVANSLESKISVSRDVSRNRNAGGSGVTQGVSSIKDIAKPHSASPTAQRSKNQMSPTKKQALDAILKQIAKKRGDA